MDQPAEELLIAAEQKLGSLRSAERRVLNMIAAGEAAELGPDLPRPEDPERLVSAQLLNWLVLASGWARTKEARALNLSGAQVEGAIDLQDSSLPVPLSLIHCRIPQGLDLRGFRAPRLELTGSTTGNLTARRLKIETAVALNNGYVCHGIVDLGNADIGALFLPRADLRGQAAEGAPGRIAFVGQNMRVGRVYGHELKTLGDVKLQGMAIAGDVELDGATLWNPEGSALGMDGAKIGGRLFLRADFRAWGSVTLRSGEVGSEVDLVRARFECRHHWALDFSRSTFKGSIHAGNQLQVVGGAALFGARIEGYLHLNGSRLGASTRPVALGLDGIRVAGDVQLSFMLASRDVIMRGARIGGTLFTTAARFQGRLLLERTQVGALVDDRRSWPDDGALGLLGFTYGMLGEGAPVDADNRRLWLGRQSREALASQPYEHLVSVLRSMGHEADAREIAIAKQRALRGRLRPLSLSWIWSLLMDGLVGYGYRQLRPVLGLAALLVLGAFIFGQARRDHLICPVLRPGTVAPAPCMPPQDHPPFVAWAYSFEQILPRPDFGQKASWALRGTDESWGYRRYGWAHQLIGWALLIVLALSPTRLLRKD